MNTAQNNITHSPRRRSSGRMNFVDIILILLALVCLGAFVYFAFFSELDMFGKKDEKVTLEYTVTVKKVNAELLGLDIPSDRKTLDCDFIDKKDRVYDSESGEAIGRVLSLEYMPSREMTSAVDSDGNVIYAEYPGYVDIAIVISGSGEMSDGVYTINGYEIRVGAEIEFHTQSYTAVGTIEQASGKEMAENAE